MSGNRRISKALAALLPGGTLGASLLLALTSSASEARTSQAPEPISPPNIAERLSAIRAAVSVVSNPAQRSGSGEFAPAAAPEAEPTWWGNGGWGRWHWGWRNGGWPNWHNWHNWGNGGWNNGGWHNYWHNW